MARLRRSLPNLIALGALLLIGTARAEDAAARAALPGPIPWQEPSPLPRMFLQLPFEAPEVVPARTLDVGLRLLYTNSILSERSDSLSLDVHVETAQPTLFFRYGIVPGVEAQLAVPLFVDEGGFLDGPIETVEGWFHAVNPERLGRPRNEARFRLTRPDGSGIQRDGAAFGMGDVWAGVKVSLLEGDSGRRRLAARAALKFPTGRLLFGSKEVDAGLSLMAAQSWRSTALRLQVDVVAPTADLDALGLDTRVFGDAQLGVTQRLGSRVALQVQGSYHLSPLAHSGLRSIDGNTAYVLVGATVALPRSVDLQLAVVENVFSPSRGADISFLFGARAAL